MKKKNEFCIVMILEISKKLIMFQFHALLNGKFKISVIYVHFIMTISSIHSIKFFKWQINVLFFNQNSYYIKLICIMMFKLLLLLNH